MKLCIAYWGALTCSTVWASSSHQYSAAFSAAWIAVAFITFLVDVKFRSAKNKLTAKKPKMTDREAFEKYMVQYRGGDSTVLQLSTLLKGQYRLVDVQRRWFTWQAACKYKDKQTNLS